MSKRPDGKDHGPFVMCEGFLFIQACPPLWRLNIVSSLTPPSTKHCYSSKSYGSYKDKCSLEIPVVFNLHFPHEDLEIKRWKKNRGASTQVRGCKEKERGDPSWNARGKRER